MQSTAPPTMPGRREGEGTMGAIIQDAYGTCDVLRTGRIERPVIGANEVLVQVEAAGLDRGTWHLMTGLPYVMRIMGFGLRRPKNRVPGVDVAGTVVAVGSEVTRFQPGDEVFGTSRGSFAEYAPARQDRLAHKPAGLAFEQAAVIPVSGVTALQALRDRGRMKPGDKVLVVGASGGVGTYAIQLAKAMGGKVSGVASTSKLDLVRSLGADHGIDYTREDFADGTETYDLIVDIGGNSSLSRLRRALAPTGTLVMVGGESGGKLTAGFDRQLRALALSPLVGQRLTVCASRENHTDLETLARQFEAGDFIPVVETTYPLARVPEAMAHLEAGRVRGKVAIRP